MRFDTAVSLIRSIPPRYYRFSHRIALRIAWRITITLFVIGMVSFNLSLVDVALVLPASFSIPHPVKAFCLLLGLTSLAVVGAICPLLVAFSWLARKESAQ